MIEQPAVVAATQHRTVTLERAPLAQQCSACATGTGCGAALWWRWFSRPVRLRLPAPRPLAIGERVVLRVAEGWLLRAAAIAYGLPLAGLLAGALAGESLYGETGAVAAALAGLVAGSLAAARLAPRPADQITIAPQRAAEPSRRRAPHR